MSDEKTLADRYRDVVGHDPTDPPDEYRWQWDYRGTKSERDGLLGRLAGPGDDEADDRGPQPEQDESLF